MAESGKCALCQKLATNKCGGCHNAFYCSKEHQKTHWKAHKKICRPFKVANDEQLGRYLVATRNIKAGETVLKEPPLIWGPSQVTVPICLGCGNEVTQKNSRPCSKCGWPVCSETCEKAPSHLPECRYTVLRGDKVSINSFGITHPTYQCISVLRCLYQKQFLPEIWKKIAQLQSHTEERKNTAKYEHEKIAIAQFILRFFKLSNVFNEEEILDICGIVMVNSHEVPLTDPAHIAIYEHTSMFEHNCSANCNKSFTNQGGILISAGKGIAKGEHLSICYTDPLWGTPNRRYHLYESKFFWCNCLRCSDPTEFGTYFSSIRCQNGPCKGYLLPKSFIENNHNEKTMDWKCNQCETSMSSYSVQDTLENIGKDLSEIKKGKSKACKDFIRTYEELLHTNHYYLTDVKIALSQLLGQEFQGGLPALSDEDLEYKVKLCQNLNNLLTTLIPAEYRVRGLILFELHAGIAELGRRKAIAESAPDLLNEALLESKKYLAESADLLKNEPDALPEGKIYQQARKNLKDIDTVLMTVHKTFGDSPI